MPCVVGRTFRHRRSNEHKTVKIEEESETLFMDLKLKKNNILALLESDKLEFNGSQP